MDRRTFLGALSVAACTRGIRSPPTSKARAPIRAVAFDLFTLFDPRSIDAAVRAELGDDELATQWKRRTFEYCFVRAAATSYTPFDVVLEDALDRTLAGRAVVPAARARMLAAWTELDPWPDTVASLDALKSRAIALAPLANFSPTMIERLLSRARLRDYFTHVISTDRARSFKPSPAAYRLGVDVLGLPREQIAFSAFGGWDAAGAAWFGYPTFWVNRLGVAPEQLGEPTATGPDLATLVAWSASEAPRARL